MKLIRTSSLALILAAGLGGAALADKAPAPAPKAPPAKTADAPADADVQKFLTFFDKIVDAVVADKDDCTKMATDVNKLIDDNKDLLEKAKEHQAKGEKLPDEAKNHMMESSKKLFGAMQKCGNDKGVQAAFQRLPKAPPPKPAK